MMQAHVQGVRWLQVEVQGRGEKGAYPVGVQGVCSAREKRAATMMRREEEEERRRPIQELPREGDSGKREKLGVEDCGGDGLIERFVLGRRRVYREICYGNLMKIYERTILERRGAKGLQTRHVLLLLEVTC
ncbi:hypothetical protein MRB53_029989 [Persea americana]|uniref:Uncharacterized protein n=1 Tax=Persea americana TaxID=3435 RepID=A0ACC2KKC5_PERAE|nr:hypothetical protein MRB53_029989 [Persea americana]